MNVATPVCSETRLVLCALETAKEGDKSWKGTHRPRNGRTIGSPRCACPSRPNSPVIWHRAVPHRRTLEEDSSSARNPSEARLVSERDTHTTTTCHFPVSTLIICVRVSNMIAKFKSYASAVAARFSSLMSCWV